MMDVVKEYNKLAFMAPKIIEICDNLEETTVCQRELKYHIKRANIEAQKLLAKHYKLYEKYGTISSLDGENEMSTEDIYNITAKAYDFLLDKSPHEICSIAELLRQAESKGIDYSQIEVPYQPISENN